MEQGITIRECSRLTGGTLSEEYIRAACHRAEGMHRLPHFECGTKRPIIRIIPTQFKEWYMAETLAQR